VNFKRTVRSTHPGPTQGPPKPLPVPPSPLRHILGPWDNYLNVPPIVQVACALSGGKAYIEEPPTKTQWEALTLKAILKDGLK